MSHQVEDYQAVVMGGGLAGVCAAIALGRSGVKTALVQDRPVLGGNSSAEIGVPLGSADHRGRNRHSRETGILDELLAENAAFPNPSDPKTSQGFSGGIWSLVLWGAVRREKNVTLYLNAVAKDPEVQDGRIVSIAVEQSTTERDFRIAGDIFLDCSGDGRVAFESGAEFMRGREAKEQYNESMAVDEADNNTMGNSVYMRARDTGKPSPFTPPEWAYDFPTDEDFPGGLPDCPHNPKLLTGYPGGYWWIEFGGMFDTIKDAEFIRDELFRYAMGVWDHIKNHGDHGAENYVLEAINIVPGKRESRRFKGDVIMIQDDVEGLRTHEDVVAYGGWNIDLHFPPGISGGREGKFWRGHEVNVRYGIPFGALYSVNIENLLFAGRNISASNVAFGSTRVMATCAVMGQAIGTAASLCLKYGVSPRTLRAKYIGELQQCLLKQDAYLPGISNHDKSDFARQASVTASSQASLEMPQPEEYRPVSGFVAQSIPCGSGTLETLALPLQNLGEQDLIVELEIRGIEIVDQLCGPTVLATGKAALAPGKALTAFQLSRPLSGNHGFYQVSIKPQQDLHWGYTSEEVAGTQAIWQSDIDCIVRRVRGTYCVYPGTAIDCYPPEAVISGVTRAERSPNLWISERNLPQWLELRWDAEKQFNAVQIIFDNNLDRPIRRVHDHLVAPELVKDYKLLVETANGEWRQVLAIEGNSHRRRNHQLTLIKTKAIRLQILATNGAENARVYEIRTYLEGNGS